jgi:hypothetical protein
VEVFAVTVRDESYDLVVDSDSRDEALPRRVRVVVVAVIVDLGVDINKVYYVVSLSSRSIVGPISIERLLDEGYLVI